MITENLVTGNWTGFYIESHQRHKGWMHLYLEFDGSNVRGEGTDYVGPWTLKGEIEKKSSRSSCRWIKQYLGKHSVQYEGESTADGIFGSWRISDWLTGSFHVWPAFRGDIQAAYWKAEQPGESE